MSNNKYTSPRVYASRGYKPKYKTKRTKFEQGSGYALDALPTGLSYSEFKKLYTHWENQLAESGFQDIEYRSPSHTGHFTPFFRQNGSSATFMRAYDPAKEEYYALTRSFSAYMNEYPYPNSNCNRWAAAFRGQSAVYKLLWYYHLEGVPYRGVAKAFSGLDFKWSSKVDKVPLRLQKPRSVFWAHQHTHKVLDLFWKWVKANYGFDDPRRADEPDEPE